MANEEILKEGSTQGADMLAAIEEANLPEAIVEDIGAKEEAHRNRMIWDDFDEENPIEMIHPEDEVRLNWQKIRLYASRKEIKNCEVLGCAKLPQDAGVYIITKIHDFRVIIAADDFFYPHTFSDNLNEMDAHTRCERQIQMAQRMLGAKISVVITNASSIYNEKTGERTYAVAASRVAAATIRQNYFFFGMNAGRHMPQVGDTVKARILLVSENSVVVEACGLELRVPFRRMTGRKFLTSENFLRYFPKDRAVPMIVTRISVNKEERTVSWQLSHREAEDAAQKVVLDESYIGRRFLGEVIAITPTHYICYCESENVTCSSPINRYMGDTRLRQGDQVALQVYGVANSYLKCNCRKI